MACIATHAVCRLGHYKFACAEFLNDPTRTTFGVRTDEPDRNYFNLGFGAFSQFAQGRSAFLFGETMLGRAHTALWSITAGVRLTF